MKPDALATPEPDISHPLTELISHGATVMRLENEQMAALAVQRPRDEAKVRLAALTELDAMPEDAASAFYSIPYKKREDGKEETVWVEGPSVKAAMAMARRWGNCTTAARPGTEDTESVWVTGLFLDYETMFRIERPYRVPKIQKRKGRLELLAGKDLDNAIQAGALKAVRNAILAGLPPGLVSAYFRRAKELVVGGKARLDKPAKPKKVDEIALAFGKWTVTLPDLEGHIGRPAEHWTGEDIAKLRGLYNAIRDGQTTVEEMFRKLPEPQQFTLTPEAAQAGKVETHSLSLDEQDQERRALMENVVALERSLRLKEQETFALRREHMGTEIIETASHDGLVSLYDELKQRETKRNVRGAGA